MTTHIDRKAFNRFDRWAIRVADLMMRDPQSIRRDATIRETINYFSDKGTAAAPVINEAGRPIGVLSLSDLVRVIGDHGIEDKTISNMKASDFMTPFVIFVNADTPVHCVVGALVDYKVRQLFVADDNGVIVGVVSTDDLLRDFGRRNEELCLDGCAAAA